MGTPSDAEFRKMKENLEQMATQLEQLIEAKDREEGDSESQQNLHSQETQKADRYDVWMRSFESFVFVFIILFALVSFFFEMASTAQYLSKNFPGLTEEEYVFCYSAEYDKTNTTERIIDSNQKCLQHRGGAIVQSLMLLFIFAEVITVARLYISDNMRGISVEDKSYHLTQGAITILLVAIVRQIILLDEGKIDVNNTIQVVFFSVTLIVCLISIYTNRFMFSKQARGQSESP